MLGLRTRFTMRRSIERFFMYNRQVDVISLNRHKSEVFDQVLEYFNRKEMKKVEGDYANGIIIGNTKFNEVLTIQIIESNIILSCSSKSFLTFKQDSRSITNLSNYLKAINITS